MVNRNEINQRVSGKYPDGTFCVPRFPHMNGLSAKPDSLIHIYLAASDKDLLNQVNRVLQKRGMMGLVDMSGRIKFVLDGRKGANYAARRFSDYASEVALSFRDQLAVDDSLVESCIDNIMSGYGFRTRLRGYVLLKRMLFLTFRDPALISPITKRLYPVIAEEFRITLPQIERNLRYLIKTLLDDETSSLRQGKNKDQKPFWLSCDNQEGKPTITSTLARLHDQVMKEFRSQLSQKQNKC
ncbi:MAG: hypothetical protein GX314_06615 [Clostridiaceae bacterium]|nr:hypothetical protein [Clostridiaceae bacterium]